MGTKASQIRVTPDADEAVALRSAGDGPVTETKIETSVSLNKLTAAPWDDGAIPFRFAIVALNVAALNLSTNAYAIELLVDSAPDMDDAPVVVASYPVSNTGVYEMVLDGRSIETLHPTAKYLAARVSIGGTPDSPSITYSAWLARTQ